MSVWKDPQGRTWQLTINVNSIKRVRQLAGIDLLDVFDGRILARLAEDPELLVNTLWAVCMPQAEQLSVSEDAFAELLVGDEIERAATALVEGLIAFFPSDRREVLRRLWTAMGKAQSEAINLATSKLETGRIDQTIKAVMDSASAEIDRELQKLRDGSGSSRESSASTPAP